MKLKRVSEDARVVPSLSLPLCQNNVTSTVTAAKEAWAAESTTPFTRPAPPPPPPPPDSIIVPTPHSGFTYPDMVDLTDQMGQMDVGGKCAFCRLNG